MTTPPNLRDRIRASKRLRDHPAPAATTAAAPVPATAQAIIDEFQRMQDTPDSGAIMCHQQGKTAVYLSADHKYIVEHPPHGPITRTPRTPAASRPGNR